MSEFLSLQEESVVRPSMETGYLSNCFSNLTWTLVGIPMYSTIFENMLHVSQACRYGMVQHQPHGGAVASQWRCLCFVNVRIVPRRFNYISTISRMSTIYEWKLHKWDQEGDNKKCGFLSKPHVTILRHPFFRILSNQNSKTDIRSTAFVLLIETLPMSTGNCLYERLRKMRTVYHVGNPFQFSHDHFGCSRKNWFAYFFHTPRSNVRVEHFKLSRRHHHHFYPSWRDPETGNIRCHVVLPFQISNTKWDSKLPWPSWHGFDSEKGWRSIRPENFAPRREALVWPLHAFGWSILSLPPIHEIQAMAQRNSMQSESTHVP